MTRPLGISDADLRRKLTSPWMQVSVWSSVALLFTAVTSPVWATLTRSTIASWVGIGATLGFLAVTLILERRVGRLIRPRTIQKDPNA